MHMQTLSATHCHDEQHEKLETAQQQIICEDVITYQDNLKTMNHTVLLQTKAVPAVAPIHRWLPNAEIDLQFLSTAAKSKCCLLFASGFADY